MTGKKTFVEPVLFKHKEKLDEVTKTFNDLGSHGTDTCPTRRHHRRNRRRHRGFR